jgi:DMSO/TMAO reductase YedYZ molybdopterin-dependent catalytic subunit
MIVQRTRPPWLETPFEVFDKGVFTPNDQHFVSWHYAGFATDPDVSTYSLKVHGLVNTPLSLSLADLMAMPRIEYAAVSQCAGNSRIYMQPRVAGAQWANGSMSNAIYTGVRLKDVLDRAGVKPGAMRVRFGGMDEAPLPDTPKFMKSIDIDHARDGEVMIAYAMNGKQLPMLNGFPIKIIVPGWCAVYWVKMLNDIEVMDQPDTNYYTANGYREPDTPHGSIKPTDTDFKLVSITKMVPRSFITNIRDGGSVKIDQPNLVRGIAFGGDKGVAAVDLSIDGGKSWMPAQLGKDEGNYSFRQWQTSVSLPSRGAHTLMVRCTNTDRIVQPLTPVWNRGGYMQNVIERINVNAA